MDEHLLKVFLPKRPRDAQKGDFGQVLVIGGNQGMAGAVRMAAEASARVGAGLVRVATRPEHASIVQQGRPELLCYAVHGADDLLQLFEKTTVMIVGPGLGHDSWAHDLWVNSLSIKKPMVVDADALNLLAKQPKWCPDWILTPHPGEAARLLQSTVAHIQADRLLAAREIQNLYGGVCVLKGAGTWVVGHQTWQCAHGNPGMASGGMGDVLSGVIGGLLAQGLSLECAAAAGVFVHAKAGDLAALKQGERGLLASDLIPYLQNAVNPN